MRRVLFTVALRIPTVIIEGCPRGERVPAMGYPHCGQPLGTNDSRGTLRKNYRCALPPLRRHAKANYDKTEPNQDVPGAQAVHSRDATVGKVVNQ